MLKYISELNNSLLQQSDNNNNFAYRLVLFFSLINWGIVIEN